MNDSKPVRHVKKIAKRIKKKYPHMSLMKVQHDLAQHLDYINWSELLANDAGLLQSRIDKKDLEGLLK